MKYVLLILALILLPSYAQAVTVDVQQKPDGCETSLITSCDGWLFTYHYNEPRPTIVVVTGADGRPDHKRVMKPTDATFGYFVWNHPHGQEPYAPDIMSAAKLADAQATKQNIK